MLRKTGLIGYAMDNYVKTRLKVTNEREAALLVKLTKMTCSRPESAEVAITMMFGWGAYAREPLCLRLPELSQQMHFYYGDSDWMSKTKIESMIANNEITEGSTCTVVPDCGHQLVMQQPLECCAQVAHVVFGEDKAREMRERFAEMNIVEDQADTETAEAVL